MSRRKTHGGHCNTHRMCCDGLCQQGRDCPALRVAQRPGTAVLRLAPGVLDGPVRVSMLARLKRFLMRAGGQPK